MAGPTPSTRPETGLLFHAVSLTGLYYSIFICLSCIECTMECFPLFVVVSLCHLSSKLLCPEATLHSLNPKDLHYSFSCVCRVGNCLLSFDAVDLCLIYFQAMKKCQFVFFVQNTLQFWRWAKNKYTLMLLPIHVSLMVKAMLQQNILYLQVHKVWSLNIRNKY